MMTTKIDYASSGDFWNAISLLLTLSYTFSTLFLRDSGLFDAEWEQEGFCIANPQVDFFSSHDTALYVDLILFSILMYLRSQWKDLPQMQGSFAARAPMHAFGMLGHGFGHGMLAQALRNGNMSEQIANWKMSPYAIIGFTLFFWFPVLKPTLYQLSPIYSFGVSLASAIGQMFLPLQFQFIYVQTIIMVCFGFNELSLPLSEKQSYHYSITPLVTAIPIMLTGWTEALFCTSFFKAIGGHCWFDASIGIAIIVFYVMCYNGSEETTVVTEDKIK